MVEGIDELLASSVDWQPIPDRPYHFAATVSGIDCVLRLNDFPDENIASLLFGEVQHELDDFPELWRLPRHRGEYDAESDAAPNGPQSRPAGELHGMMWRREEIQ